MSSVVYLCSGRKREREKMEEREGWEGGARERDGDKGKPSKKRRKSSSGMYIGTMVTVNLMKSLVY